MIFSAQQIFSDDQVVTASAASTGNGSAGVDHSPMNNCAISICIDMFSGWSVKALSKASWLFLSSPNTPYERPSMIQHSISFGSSSRRAASPSTIVLIIASCCSAGRAEIASTCSCGGPLSVVTIPGIRRAIAASICALTNGASENLRLASFRTC